MLLILIAASPYSMYFYPELMAAFPVYQVLNLRAIRTHKMYKEIKYLNFFFYMMIFTSILLELYFYFKAIHLYEGMFFYIAGPCIIILLISTLIVIHKNEWEKVSKMRMLLMTAFIPFLIMIVRVGADRSDNQDNIQIKHNLSIIIKDLEKNNEILIKNSSSESIVNFNQIEKLKSDIVQNSGGKESNEDFHGFYDRDVFHSVLMDKEESLLKWGATSIEVNRLSKETLHSGEALLELTKIQNRILIQSK